MSTSVRYLVTVQVRAKFGQGIEESQKDLNDYLADMKDYYCQLVKIEREREKQEERRSGNDRRSFRDPAI